jgi:hypothetical protein
MVYIVVIVWRNIENGFKALDYLPRLFVIKKRELYFKGFKNIIVI